MQPICCWVILFGLCSTASGEEADGDAARAERLAFLKSQFETFDLFVDDRDRPLPRSQEPVIRYTNPIRSAQSDAATFLWLDGKRPVAVAALSVRDNGAVFREFVSLTDRPLRCERDGRTVWTPEGNDAFGVALPDAPTPSPNTRLRLIQMRRLAERFRFALPTRQTELRLLPQPVHRYADPATGIVDGVIFAIAEGTDPEALLILEAFTPADGAEKNPQTRWRYTLAKLTSLPVTVWLDGQQVWQADGYWQKPRPLHGSYVEVPLGRYEAPADP